eukprot:5819893-Pyramimonas_sp.AAC.1
MASMTGPRASQASPRWPQDGSKTAQDSLRQPHDGPRSTQEASKTAQEVSKGSCRKAPRGQSHRCAFGVWAFASLRHSDGQRRAKRHPGSP